MLSSRILTVGLLALSIASNRVMADDAAVPDAVPVDCQGDWIKQGDCSTKCGCGVETIIYQVNTPAENGGQACEAADGRQKKGPCELKPCPESPQYSAWGKTTDCSHTCGEGTYSQSREIMNLNTYDRSISLEDLTKTVPCEDLPPCAIDCKESEWSAWEPCSQTCGEGLTFQTRAVEVEAQHGGTECGQLVQEKKCFIADCPISYTSWPNTASTGSDLSADLSDLGEEVEGEPACRMAPSELCMQKCSNTEGCAGFDVTDGKCCFRSSVSERTPLVSGTQSFGRQSEEDVKPVIENNSNLQVTPEMAVGGLSFAIGGILAYLFYKNQAASSSKGSDLYTTPATTRREPRSSADCPTERR